MAQQDHRPVGGEVLQQCCAHLTERQWRVGALVIGSDGFELTGQVDRHGAKTTVPQRVQNRGEVLLGAGVPGQQDNRAERRLPGPGGVGIQCGQRPGRAGQHDPGGGGRGELFATGHDAVSPTTWSDLVSITMSPTAVASTRPG